MFVKKKTKKKKQQESRSDDIKNVKSRSADIKIHLSIRHFTLGPNFMSVHQKARK
jgi:hypothetical protein